MYERLLLFSKRIDYICKVHRFFFPSILSVLASTRKEKLKLLWNCCWLSDLISFTYLSFQSSAKEKICKKKYFQVRLIKEIVWSTKRTLTIIRIRKIFVYILSYKFLFLSTNLIFLSLSIIFVLFFLGFHQSKRSKEIRNEGPKW